MTDRESYIRQETVTGVVPMLKGDRQYSFLDLFLSTYPTRNFATLGPL